jgi:hypothetical protein
MNGFHAGELAVQRRAGVQEAAERLVGMLDAPDMSGGFTRFLAERTFAGVTAPDPDGRLWITPVTGPAGFLRVTGPDGLRVDARPGGPLAELVVGRPVGLLAIEFAKRRRVRVNGTVTGVDASGFDVSVEQAYGNCPKYIHPRELHAPTGSAAAPAVRRGETLTEADAELVRRADTFLLGTGHPTRGADASHRGGPAGFVRVVDERTLWWPDLPGNNIFNSLGNLAVDPAAALAFVDFAGGDTLHLSGTARLEWTPPDPEVDGGTGRRVRFTVQRLVAGPRLGLRSV